MEDKNKSMSDKEQSRTTTLLPEARVSVFSKDAETLAAGQAVADDWRFARVKVSLSEGDIQTAIAQYQQNTSPDLIILQTETIDDSLPAALEDLAQYCEENTAAIIIGPVNDVYLYRKLIEMGVSDYLVKPVKPEDLSEVIAKTLIDRLGVSGSSLIAFIGAKGGVGATTIAHAAARGIADVLDQKSIFMDSAGGWSTLSVGIGFEPATTLSEAAKAAEAQDDDNLRRMVFKASDKLDVLASGGEVMLEPTVRKEQLEILIDALMVKYPTVIADLSFASAEQAKTVIARAHKIFVVSTPVLPSLRLTRSLIQEIKEIRGDDEHGIEMVINMSGIAPAHEVGKSDIEKALDFPVSTTIPFDPKIFISAESEGKSLTETKEGTEIVMNSLLPLMQKVLNLNTLPVSKEPAKGGFMGMLSGLFK